MMMTKVVRVFQIMSAMMMVMMVMTVMVVVVNVFQILRKPNLDSFSRRGLIRSDKANFLSFWSLNIQRLFWRFFNVLCFVCLGREKYGPFIALTPSTDWWVKRSLYPGTRGEKVSKLRSCQYVIFCLSNAQKSSPSTEIQFYNIVHICFVYTLHIHRLE